MTKLSRVMLQVIVAVLAVGLLASAVAYAVPAWRKTNPLAPTIKNQPTTVTFLGETYEISDLGTMKTNTEKPYAIGTPEQL